MRVREQVRMKRYLKNCVAFIQYVSWRVKYKKKIKNKRNFQLKLPAWYVQHDKINGQTDKLKIKSDRSYTR